MWHKADSYFDTTRIWWAGWILVSISFIFATCGYAARFSFSSDDVALQNILQAIQSGQPFRPSTGSATWVLKVPVYLVVGALVPNGTLAITICILLLNVPLVAGVLFVARRLVLEYAGNDRRAMVGAMVVMWCFFAARPAQNSVLMGTNARNGEIGLALIIGYLIIGALRQRSTRSRLQSSLRLVACTAMLALLVLDDNLWLDVLVPTLLLLVLITWLRSGCTGRAALTVLCVVVVGSAGGVCLLSAAQSFGLMISQNFNSTLITPAGIMPGLGGAFGAIIRNFNGDVWGRPVSAALLPPAAQFVCAVICLMLGLLAASRIRTDSSGLRTFLVLGIVIDLALDIATGNAAVDENFRYAVIAAVFLLLLAVIGIGDFLASGPRLRITRLAVLVGVLCAILPLVLNIRLTTDSIAGRLPDPQVRTHEIISIAEKRGLSVGLGQYWDASVTSYFSGRRVRVSPVLCSSGGIGHFPFLVNTPEAYLSAPRMFVVTNAAFGCSPDIVLKAYGRPLQKVQMTSSSDQVWIYDRPLF